MVTFHFTLVHLSPVVVNVVNEDSGQLAQNFLSQLKPDVVELVSRCLIFSLSGCSIYNMKMKGSSRFKFFKLQAQAISLDNAKVNLVNFDVYGVIHIHPNFSELLEER